MTRPRPRGVATVLLAAALLVSLVAPLNAAPPARTAAEARTALGLADALMAWLADLWPGPGPVDSPVDGPTARVQAKEDDLDPDGQPGVQSLDSCSDPSGALTVTPQLGCEIDPSG